MGMQSGKPKFVANSHSSPLAIVGLAFEFPQEATSEEAFWQMLRDARSASTDFPKDRLNIDAFYHPDESRTGSVGQSRPRLEVLRLRCPANRSLFGEASLSRKI